jgi:3-oxoacyl-[acyl-carrier protein] reductase
MNPVALITGGSRGIGRGIALELAKTGCDLAINFVSRNVAAEQTTADCRAAGAAQGRSVRALPCQADLAVGKDRERLIEFVRDRFGRLDILVNNAGVAPEVRADLLEATEESFDRLVRINVKAPYFLTQLVARWMIEQVNAETAAARKESGPALQEVAPTRAYRPKIINVSSVSAYAASVNRGDYCISKSALSMVTALYTARLAEYGINVYEIRPGLIATDMTAPVKEKYDRRISAGLTPIARWGTPEDVGRAVAAIAQDLLPFSTGEVINVDGGFHLRSL